jgi:thioredoxin reductase (NADPH)
VVIRDDAHGEEIEAGADALFVMIGGWPMTAGWRDVAPRRTRISRHRTGSGPRGGAKLAWPLARASLVLESSEPDLFVAGDVRHGSIKRVVSAVGEGAIAVALIHGV